MSSMLNVVYAGDNADRYSILDDSGDVTAVAAGYCHSMVLKEDGTVIKW